MHLPFLWFRVLVVVKMHQASVLDSIKVPGCATELKVHDNIRARRLSLSPSSSGHGRSQELKKSLP